MPDATTVGGFKASGAPLEDYLRARSNADLPPGVGAYSAGAAPMTGQQPTGMTAMQRASALATSARSGLMRWLGIGAQSAAAQPVAPDRTAALEASLNALQARSAALSGQTSRAVPVQPVATPAPIAIPSSGNVPLMALRNNAGVQR